ncbi:MAG: Ig-like domain-containing protein [Cytophagaceae bacterium]
MKTIAHVIFKRTIIFCIVLLASAGILQAQNTASAPISLSGQSNMTIADKDFSGGSNACIFLSNCSNIKISNCRFINIPTINGVQLSQCSNIEIVNCYFESFMGGVYADRCTGGLNIHCNSFKNVVGPRPRGQIVQFNNCTGTGNKINYNILDHEQSVNRTPEDLINVYQSTGTAADPIQIIGNNLRGGGPSTTGGGIIAADNGGGYVLVQDNILVDPGQYGIAAPSGHHVTIKNNKIFARQQPFTNVGIYVGDQGEITSGVACNGPTIVVDGNQVNWTNKNGIKNPWYNCACCPNAVNTNNNWKATFGSEILPTVLVKNTAQCGTSTPPAVSQTPYGGTPGAIPGKIEAEGYDLGGEGIAYHDVDATNNGSALRTDGVDLEATMDTDAGYDVGYTAAGEWMEYTVNVTAGSYKLDARVASINTGKNFHVELDGVNISGAISIPNTGGWQNWQTVSVTTTALSAGTKILKIVMDTDGFNLNHLTFSLPSAVNQIPTVSITAPIGANTFTAPASITINASASDADGTISKVDFYNGSTLLGSDAIAPYSFVWNNLAAGSYTISAKATDNVGAVATSSSVSILVNAAPVANQAPVASISSPSSGANFTAPASITINASASDADGTISKVDFYNGAVLLGSDATPPYSFTIASAPAGTYTLKAVATDNAGSTGASAVVSVTVNNMSTSIGISGPSCVNPGVNASFILTSDPGFASATWWTSAEATVSVNSSDNKKATITYTPNASGSITVSCGANLNAAPWYKEYTKTIQVGGCSTARMAAPGDQAAEVNAAPNPFDDQTIISVNGGEKILSVKLFDMNGTERLNTGNIDQEKITLGNDLKPGIYILNIVTESGTQNKRIVKTE